MSFKTALLNDQRLTKLMKGVSVRTLTASLTQGLNAVAATSYQSASLRPFETLLGLAHNHLPCMAITASIAYLG